jgi:hypothetical protein
VAGVDLPLAASADRLEQCSSHRSTMQAERWLRKVVSIAKFVSIDHRRGRDFRNFVFKRTSTASAGQRKAFCADGDRYPASWTSSSAWPGRARSVVVKAATLGHLAAGACFALFWFLCSRSTAPVTRYRCYSKLPGAQLRGAGILWAAGQSYGCSGACYCGGPPGAVRWELALLMALSAA